MRLNKKFIVGIVLIFTVSAAGFFVWRLTRELIPPFS